MKNINKIYIYIVGCITLVILTIIIINLIPKESNSIDIIFDTNGGSAVEYSKDTKTLSDVPLPTKEGYTFLGWYTDSECLGVQVESLSEIKNKEVLFAKWGVKEFTISFKNTYNTDILDIKASYLSVITKPKDPVRPGYKFLGWYIDKNFTTLYTFSTVPAKNIDLYAGWESITYHVYVDSSINGDFTGSGDYKLNETVSLTATPKQGFRFLGWYTDDNFLGIPVSTNLNYTFLCKASDTYLYAKIEQISINEELDISVEDTVYGNKINIIIEKNTTESTVNFLFKEVSATEDTYNSLEPKDVGEYTVKAYLSDTSNFITKNFKINKATYDMSNVSFIDETYIYNGTEKKIEITGELPLGVKVTYTTNTLTNVGSVSATASFSGTNNYLPIPDLKAVLSVSKKELKVSYLGESVIVDENPALSLVFDGFVAGESTSDLEKVPTILNSNDQIGIYTLIPFGGESNNYSFTYISGELQITDKIYDMSLVSFTDKTFSYNGREQELIIDGSLPEGVNVTYTNNKLISAGSVLVTASFTGSDEYMPIPDLTATLSITKVELTVIYTGESVVYGNTPLLNVNIEGFVGFDSRDVLEIQPEVENTNTDVGIYILTPKGGGSINYNFIYISGELIIEKATYDLSNIKFDDQEFSYDGEAHSIYVDGAIPLGLNILYTNNEEVNVGTFLVTAVFTGDSNYYPVDDVVAYLSISKVDLMIMYLGEEVVYGEDPTLLINISGFVDNENINDLLEVPTIENNNKDVGTYILTPKGAISNNYTFTYVSGNLNIIKAAYDMSKVYFVDQEYTYDGTTKTLLITGTLPDGVTATYSTNQLTNVGSLPVSVSFTGSPNYKYITSMSAVLTIEKAYLTVTYFGETIIYGQSPSLAISITGFVSGETVDDLDTVPTISNSNFEVGEYELFPVGGSSSNYDFIYVSGSLIINEDS